MISFAFSGVWGPVRCYKSTPISLQRPKNEFRKPFKNCGIGLFNRPRPYLEREHLAALRINCLVLLSQNVYGA